MCELWAALGTSATAGYTDGHIPPVFCAAGFSSFYTMFVVRQADIVCQVCSEPTWWVAMCVNCSCRSDLYARPYSLLPNETGALFGPETTGGFIGQEDSFVFHQHLLQQAPFICGCFGLLAYLIHFCVFCDVFHPHQAD